MQKIQIACRFPLLGVAVVGWALLAQSADGQAQRSDPPQRLTLDWQSNLLTIYGEQIPGGSIEIHYLEAYCRPNSQTTDWVRQTVIGHQTRRIALSDDRAKLRLQCKLNDGVIVDHVITARDDEVDFRITAHNPTNKSSQAHWAQPCVRVGRFTGCGPEQTDDDYAYIKNCFVFLDGKHRRLPTEPWATEARYTPGQVWAAPGVPRQDVNPRPLNPKTPSCGLIGCFSGDQRTILALAFEPYQELFQGVIRCLHSDFRLGGLSPGVTKSVRGKLYLVPNDLPTLMQRYRRDFPEHQRH
jgi:hypothetical protein